MKQNNLSDKIIKEIKALKNADKARHQMRFFKCGKGQYGEGDLFLGVTVPEIRKIAKKYFREINLDEIEPIINSKYHELRLTALLILTYKMEKLKDNQSKKLIFDFYIKHIDCVNNWDLVDLSADKILGEYLFDKDRSILFQLARSNHLWKERIAIIATFNFIKKGDFSDTLNIAEILLDHKHDLIHKAVGWMLREIGKRNLEAEIEFLNLHYKSMPRTMLRYAIEKFDENLRMRYLKGEIH